LASEGLSNQSNSAKDRENTYPFYRFAVESCSGTWSSSSGSLAALLEGSMVEGVAEASEVAIIAIAVSAIVAIAVENGGGRKQRR
jgi:hypothetical protein